MMQELHQYTEEKNLQMKINKTLPICKKDSSLLLSEKDLMLKAFSKIKIDIITSKSLPNNSSKQ